MKQNNMKVDLSSITGENPEAAAPSTDKWQ